MGEQTHVTGYIDSAACPADVRLVSVVGQERLGHAFQYVVEFETTELDLEAAIGQGVYANISDERRVERHVHGIVERAEVTGRTTSDAFLCKVYLRPPPYLVNYRYGSQIFQELSVPDIVKKVFRDAGLADDLFRWDIQGSYPARDYCVQYNEDEWSFICRLLEDEGIWFAFEHAIDGVQMVFADASDKVEPIPCETLRHTIGSSIGAFDQERAWQWRKVRRLVEGKVSLDDYDGLHPSLDLTADAENEEIHAREHYEYPSGCFDAGEAGRRAGIRLEELSTRSHGSRAESNLLDLQPGLRFELLDHPSASGEYVITSLDLSVHLHRTINPNEDESGQNARIGLECVPRAQLFRPRRATPKPRIHGVQTARVTGPAGEEIYCDEHGRVKVQFHWDTLGQLDEKTTLWIPTTHPHTTGSVTVPRIGWEVLVQFYEGDPDRPVVLGHVFNPMHAPPFPLPASKTMTAHRTVSSPGGGATNEIFFDDAAGSQQIALNAGKDLTLNTVNNKSVHTTQHVERMVNVNRTFSVGADETISLQAKHSSGVGANHSISIGANREVKVSGGASVTVTGSTTMDIGGLENMMIGNPIDAVLQIVKSEAKKAAEGVAAKAADRVQGALLGPVMPALDAVNGALGDAAGLVGPASAILGADNPAVALYGDVLDKVSAATTPPDLAGMAGGMASAVVNDAFDALTGGGGGGGDGSGGGATGGSAGSAGSGVWGPVVGGDMTETIGALGTFCSAYGVTFNIGGDNKETVGAARAEIVKGGHSESCKSKTETVGVYFVNASSGFSVDAEDAITINTAACKWNIGKAYSAKADGVLAVTAASIDLDAAETVTLKCGSAEVIIDKSGIACNGAIEVTVQAGTIELDPPLIKPG